MLFFPFKLNQVFFRYLFLFLKNWMNFAIINDSKMQFIEYVDDKGLFLSLLAEKKNFHQTFNGNSPSENI